MNEFAPPYVEQIPTSTLQRTLDMYEEIIDVLEEMPREHSASVRRGILRAREIVQLEIIRRRVEYVIEEAKTE